MMNRCPCCNQIIQDKKEDKNKCVKKVIINNDNIMQDWWYFHCKKLTYIVRDVLGYWDLKDIEDYKQYNPKDFYIITEGGLAGSIILKKDCKVIEE